MEKLIRWIDGMPRWAAIILGVIWWFVLYELPNNLPIKTPVMAFETIEDWVPFIPATTIIYLSVIVQMILGMAIIPKKDFARMFVAGALLTLFSSAIFFALPTYVPRGYPAEDSAWIWLYNLMCRMDAPLNACPSLHVGFSILLSLVLWRGKKKTAIVFSIWTLLVAVSTLTTKQHNLIDLVDGASVALVCYWWMLPQPPQK